MDPINPLQGDHRQAVLSASTPSRPATYRPRRARWPGLVGVAVILAAVVAFVAWSRHDSAGHAGHPSMKSALEQPEAQAGPGDAVNKDLAMTDATTAAIAVAPAKQ